MIAKIPKADPARFEAVLRGHIEEGSRRDPVAEEFRDIHLCGHRAACPPRATCRTSLISVGAGYLPRHGGDIYDGTPYARSSSMDIDLYFGIKEQLRHDSFPPAPYGGRGASLLRHHHEQRASTSMIQVFNHSADWYAHPRLRDPLEPAWEVELTFADGTTRKQWVEPEAMGPLPRHDGRALSAPVDADGARELAARSRKAVPHRLDAHSPRHSCAAAITPRSPPSSQASRSPIRTRPARPCWCCSVRATTSRWTAVAWPNESQTSSMTGHVPDLPRRPSGLRRWSASRRTRCRTGGTTLKRQLLISNSGLWPRAFRRSSTATSPPCRRKSSRTSQTCMWRLAIHRMDFRQYEVSDTARPRDSWHDGQRRRTAESYVRLDPKPPDADVQAMVDEGAERFAAMNARLAVFDLGTPGLQARHRPIRPDAMGMRSSPKRRRWTARPTIRMPAGTAPVLSRLFASAITGTRCQKSSATGASRLSVPKSCATPTARTTWRACSATPCQRIVPAPLCSRSSSSKPLAEDKLQRVKDGVGGSVHPPNRGSPLVCDVEHRRQDLGRRPRPCSALPQRHRDGGRHD